MGAREESSFSELALSCDLALSGQTPDVVNSSFAHGKAQLAPCWCLLQPGELVLPAGLHGGNLDQCSGGGCR